MGEREDEDNSLNEDKTFFDDYSKTEGLGWRVSLSIVTGVGWLVFVVIWLFFYADDYNGYQNLGMLLLSIFIVALVLGIPWTLYGWRYRTEKEEKMMQVKGFKMRVLSSVIAVNALLIFLIIWLFNFASDYTFFQNVAVFIAAMLVFGGVMGALWAAWGMKHQHEFEE